MKFSSIAVFPGTFDPPTFGHLDIIKRASRLTDKLLIGVALNERKKPLFDVKTRANMIRDLIDDDKDCGDNIEIHIFDSLLIDFMKHVGAKINIRGLRVATDFSYEFQMSCINRRLDDNIETVFLAAIEENQFVTSSFAKEIARFGGDVSKFLPEKIAMLLEERIKGEVGR